MTPTNCKLLLMALELKNGNRTFYAKNRKAWRAWLQKNGDKEMKVWLVIYKKGTGKPSVYYDEAVEEALCFGWIDSIASKRDEESYYQFFARRNPKSKWSGLNKNRVERLLKEGLMTPAGLALVEEAKRNGAWEALDEVEALVVPKELELALNGNSEASKYFSAFPPSARRGILDWISSAKRDETRAKRIAETVQLAGKNIRANQYVKK
jgi:uncharacterized protein YdeI (YjbR/CyaY-like superfamily)